MLKGGTEAFLPGPRLKHLVALFLEEHGLKEKHVAVVVGDEYLDGLHAFDP